MRMEAQRENSHSAPYNICAPHRALVCVHMFKNRNGSLCSIVINKIANTQIETINDDNNTTMSNAIYLLHQISIRSARVLHIFSSFFVVKVLNLTRRPEIPFRMVLNPVRFYIFVTQNCSFFVFFLYFRLRSLLAVMCNEIYNVRQKCGHLNFTIHGFVFANCVFIFVTIVHIE